MPVEKFLEQCRPVMRLKRAAPEAMFEMPRPPRVESARREAGKASGSS